MAALVCFKLFVLPKDSDELSRSRSSAGSRSVAASYPYRTGKFAANKAEINCSIIPWCFGYQSVLEIEIYSMTESVDTMILA